MKLAPSPPPPLELTLTRSVVPRRRSRTKTSSQPLVSPGTRLSVSDTNTTNRPSADIHPPPPSTGLPSDVRLTSSTPSPSAARAWGPPPAARPIARAPLIHVFIFVLPLSAEFAPPAGGPQQLLGGRELPADFGAYSAARPTMNPPISADGA